jgi:large subunit ribosomal protein L35
MPLAFIRPVPYQAIPTPAFQEIVRAHPVPAVNAPAEGLVARRAFLCHNAALHGPASQGCRGDEKSSIPSERSKQSILHAHTGQMGLTLRAAPMMESKMPKLKTKSGAKKRFKITASGKVKYAQAGKRHGMIKRTTKQIRNKRGTNVLFKTDGDNIKKYWLPNG